MGLPLCPVVGIFVVRALRQEDVPSGLAVGHSRARLIAGGGGLFGQHLEASRPLGWLVVMRTVILGLEDFAAASWLLLDGGWLHGRS